MARFAYVDGAFVRFDNACVHIEDRGLQFGDSVYEVWAVKNRKLLDNIGHMERLSRSLSMLQIMQVLSPKSLEIIISKLLELNKIRDGLVYLQITRGVAMRDHPFPKNTQPSIIITARPKDYAALEAKAQKGLKIKTSKDIRWKRVDIKTTNLLPNVLAKQEVLDQGYDDVWFYDDAGLITEGSAQNAWILNQAGQLQTRNLGQDILGGITRQTILKVAKDNKIDVIEKAFSINEARNAKEAFVTSATSFVTAVISIDDNLIGNGTIGEVARKLRADYFANQN